MIAGASVDMGPLLRQLAELGEVTSPEVIAQAVEDDLADFYRAHRVPVQTGRLRGSLTTPRSPDRRVVVVGDKISVQIKVPYAREVLRRLPPYKPQDLTARIGKIIQDRLDRGGR